MNLISAQDPGKYIVAGSRRYLLLATAGCIALVAFLLVDYEYAAAAAKIVASTSFLAVAIRAGALRSDFGRIVFLGLAFSWFGDAFLIGESKVAFLAGLVTFLLAHIAYIAAFIVRGISMRWALLAIVPVAALGITVSLWLRPHVPPELVVPVRVYTAVICLMVTAAFGTRGRGASGLILAGALMFFLSDLSVAALRLVETDFPTYVWGLPLYYAGQILLALSTSQSAPDSSVTLQAS